MGRGNDNRQSSAVGKRGKEEFVEGPHGPIAIYGGADENTIEQMRMCAAPEDTVGAALMGDNHLGYSQPIGGVIAYRHHISPSAVGYDIACGIKGVATNLLYSDIQKDMPGIMDEVARRISFGMGHAPSEKIDHEIIDQIRREAPLPAIADMQNFAARSLGSVGSSNHFFDIFCEEKTGRVWIATHFGSRGFGHKIASGYMALAQGKQFGDQPDEGGMMSPPILIDTRSPLGHSYIEAMELAGKYAYAGRDIVIDIGLDILGAESVREVHNHHNFAWKEDVGGEPAWVMRKGATPAFPGQEGFVGGSMGENAVVLEGHNNTEATLFSTIHGAGRAMSRNEAAGKKTKRWTCTNNGCSWVQPKNTHKPEDNRCPKCRQTSVAKRWIQTEPGKINFAKVKAELARKGIELRGGGADEAPLAYKRLPAVLAAHGDQIRVLHTLRPVGVAMAGADVVDPYKD